jgi:putative transposase
MTTKRRQYSAEFKFKVALEAAKGRKTLAELASEAQIHPNQISDWKRQLLEQGANLFRRNTTGQHREHETLQAELYEQIGRLKMELEWVKKKVARDD